jgi:hypothetical protein
MEPAHQSFESADCAGLNVNQRLVEDLELAVDQRLAQVQFEHPPRLNARIHFRSKEAIPTASLPLGAIQRQVSALQQFVWIEAISRNNGDAETCADNDLNNPSIS